MLRRRAALAVTLRTHPRRPPTNPLLLPHQPQHHQLPLLQQHPSLPPTLTNTHTHILTRSLSGGGFFDNLRKSFQKEVEQNKEFKESLSKLRKETGDLTGKAQENTSKLTESVQKATASWSSKLSETSAGLTSSFTELKDKVTAAAAEATAAAKKEKEEKEEQARQQQQQQEEAQVKSTATAAATEDVRHEEFQAPPPPPRHAEAASAQWQAEQEEQEEVEAAKRRKHQAKSKTTATTDDESTSTSSSSSSTTTEDQQQQHQQQEEKTDTDTNTPPPDANASFFDRFLAGRPPKEAIIVWAKDFQVGLKEAFADLFGMAEKSTGMKKHIYQQGPAPEKKAKKEGEEEGESEEESEEEKANVGGGALVIVKQQKKPWERLAEQLKDAPIIQEILKAGTKLADTELGRQAGKIRGKLNDRVEDAREMWETSQNPLVYKLSSMWDDLTSETELGIALREIRRADPEFVLEDWVGQLSESFLPLFFKSYLKGDLKTLKPYLSEGMYKQMAEELRLRKAEGLVLDPNVLEISSCEIVQAKMHDHQPVLVLGALIQHINCVRNREGKIVEGKEDEVRASFYLLLFVREFNEEEGALEWRIQERYLGFSQPFI